jgi:hypothetical protein
MSAKIRARRTEDAPVAVEADLDLVLRLARVVRRHQALPAILDPPDRTAELHGRKWHQDVLRVELAAHAEAAAHIHLGQAQSAQRDPEDRRQDAPVDVDALGRADQVKLAALGIGRHGHEPPSLESGGGLPRIGEALADDHGRGVERRVDVADAHRDQGDVVGLGAREQERGAWHERLGGGGAGRQRIVDDVDEGERVFGDVPVIGHDQCDRLADVPDHAPGDRGLEIALDAGRGAHAIRDDGGLRHVGCREHRADARQLERPLGVDGHEPGVGVTGAEDHCVKHAGHSDVGHEASRSCREAIPADAVVRRADHGALQWDGRPLVRYRVDCAEAIAWPPSQGKGRGGIAFDAAATIWQDRRVAILDRRVPA